MKQWKRRMQGILLAWIMVLSCLMVPGSAITAKAEGEPSAFTLYYYKENATDNKMYVNLWNWNGLSIEEDSTGSNPFGWSNNMGIMKPVEGKANWYSVMIQIIDATADGEGISIYDSSSQTAEIEIDPKWNRSEDYAILVSGKQEAYAVKDGTFYTDLKAAGLDSATADDPVKDPDSATYTLEQLEKLKATVPADYTTLGFTAESVANVEKALKDVESIVNKEAPTAEEIENAYVALESAIAGLTLDSDIFVKKIAGYNTDSIRGVDVSSYLSIMDSFEAVKKALLAEGKIQAAEAVGFKDWSGNVLDKQGFFDFLASCGVNYVRTRVWNDPYDSEGNGYGGGNNDVAKAKEIAEYVTKAGMKNSIDFHFSDFWADPGKQKAPKEWADYSLEEKTQAVQTFVANSLATLENNGAVISMVQIGNETNGAFCGETTWKNMNVLFDAGCDAVHAYRSDILAVLHFTNPEKSGRLEGYAKELSDGEVSYDVFATSYYPYWHGTIQNLTKVLSTIAATYNKYVMVAETSWATTLEDGDGHENTVRAGNNDKDMPYRFSVQGQANEIREVAAAVNAVDVTLDNGDKAGLGFFYWEPAWIPVQNIAGQENAQELTKQNKTYWEAYGSGWASSYAAEYDAEDAGKWYGGSAVDNQAVFDFAGNPIASISVFKSLYYGATAAKKVDGYLCDSVSLEVGATLDGKLPSNVKVIYNNEDEEEVAVTWNQDEIAVVTKKASDNSGIGEYTISGVLDTQNADTVSCTVSVIPKNLLENASFEIADGWIAEGNGVTVAKAENPKTGDKAVHFWYDEDYAFTVSTEVTVTEPGYYYASIYAEGASGSNGETGNGDGEHILWKAKTADGTEYVSKGAVLDGWNNWKQLTVDQIYVSRKMITDGQNTVTLTMDVALQAGAWGTFDDAAFYLDKVDDTDKPGTDNPDIENPDKTDPDNPDIKDPNKPGKGDSGIVNPEKPESDDSSKQNKEQATNTLTAQQQVGDTVQIDSATYTITKTNQVNSRYDGEVTYHAITNTKASKVKVPSAVKIGEKTYQVTAIDAKAFDEGKNLKNVEIPATVTKIGKKAFAKNKKLRTIVIKSTKLKAKNIADETFKGVTKKATIRVPKKMKKVYTKLFRKKGLAKSVRIR